MVWSLIPDVHCMVRANEYGHGWHPSKLRAGNKSKVGMSVRARPAPLTRVGIPANVRQVHEEEIYHRPGRPVHRRQRRRRDGRAAEGYCSTKSADAQSEWVR